MFKALEQVQSNFLLRRLHSLSGLVPIGAFMMFHLFANSSYLVKAENYDTVINFLRNLPFLEEVEWAFIFGPLLFHALYGVLIYTTAKPNQMQYSHLENWRYIFQRLTGMIALVYILYHIFQFRLVEHLDHTYIENAMAGTQSIPGLPEIPFINPFSVYWFYVVGLLATVYHFANGLWGFCITWGITVGKKSQDLVTYLGIAVFLVFSYIGIATINELAAAGSM